MKSTQFIRSIKGDREVIYLPRPTSWLGGWSRHLWVEEHLNVKPQIASPELWQTLMLTERVQVITEDADGSITIGEVSTQ